MRSWLVRTSLLLAALTAGTAQAQDQISNSQNQALAISGQVGEQAIGEEVFGLLGDFGGEGEPAQEATGQIGLQELFWIARFLGGSRFRVLGCRFQRSLGLLIRLCGAAGLRSGSWRSNPRLHARFRRPGGKEKAGEAECEQR